jgi:uncharacterized protein YndB with AHSA1/START domain
MNQPEKTNTRQFEMQIDIRAPREAVWQAIATDVGLRRWFAPDVTVDAEVGGEIVWNWNEHHRWAQRIEILEPGTRLRTRYDSGVDDGSGGKKPLFVDFVLEGKGGMTTLRLVQSGFGPEAGFDGEYDGISRGWPVELRGLRLYLEQHAGQDRRLAWSTMDLDLDATEAWIRLTSPEGLGCGTIAETMREGEPFRFTSIDGDVFEGVALECHARQFSGDASSHGGAFLRACAEEWGGKTHIWLWLGTYDQDASTLAALQSRWDAMLERLFVTNGATAATGGASS